MKQIENQIQIAFLQAALWDIEYGNRNVNERFTGQSKTESHFMVYSINQQKLFRCLRIDLDIQRFDVVPLKGNEMQRISFGEGFIVTPLETDYKIHIGNLESASWRAAWYKRTRLTPFYTDAKMENRLIVWHIKREKFYKVLNVDIVNQRYEVFGERGHYWVSFGQGILFDWLNRDLFDCLFDLYKNHCGRIRYRSKEKLMQWFRTPTRLYADFTERLPAELDEGEFNDVYKREVLELIQKHGDISNLFFESVNQKRMDDFSEKLNTRHRDATT